MQPDLKKQLFYKMCLIRRFEERLFDLFSKGKLNGTTHASIGQESIPTALLIHLQDNDFVVSNHRCHGHYLAKTGDVEGLIAEIMGKAGGICGGRGGSQHICSKGFFTNGIQGSLAPFAVGIAYANKLKKRDSIVVLFIGDGTFGQGILYETLNLMSLWKVPVLVVVEDNQYAQSTHKTVNMAGTIKNRVEAFDISCNEITARDVIEMYDYFGGLVNRVRTSGMPHVEIINTYRLCPHSKSDDCRNEEELRAAKECDPFIILQQEFDNSEIAVIESEVEKHLNCAIRKAEEMSVLKDL